MARQQKGTTQTITDLSALLSPGLFDNFFDGIKLPASRKQKSPSSPLPHSATTPASSSYPLLPTNDSPAYLRVKTKLEHLLLESILTEASNPLHVISLSDIGRRASTNPKYIPFNEDYIPALLERYVNDGVLQQELVTLNSGRTQPIYALNALNQTKLEPLLSTTQDPFELQKALPSSWKKHRKRRIRLTPEKKQDVAALCTLGLSANDIATEIGISIANVYNVGRKISLSFKRHDTSSASSIRQLLAEDNLADIYRKFSFPSPFAFYAYCQKNNITIPENLTPIRFDGSIDTLIEQGKSLEEIGTSQGKTHQWAQQYIMGSGWHSAWQKIRHEQTQTFQTALQKQTQYELLSLLSQRLTQLAQKESWAMQKAAEYFNQLDKRIQQVKPFSCYLTIFQEYEHAQQTGEKISLKELATNAGFDSASSVDKIFKKVNVEPMFGNSIRSPKHKLEALARGAELGLGGADITYFIDYPRTNAYTYLCNHYGSSIPTAVIDLEYKQDGKKIETTIGFSLASQIYEAADAGFTIEETRELFSMKSKKHDLNKITEILNSRSEIEPLLIHLLQKLYNKPDITKPYKLNF